MGWITLFIAENEIMDASKAKKDHFVNSILDGLS